jgi:hypothetical protein
MIYASQRIAGLEAELDEAREALAEAETAAAAADAREAVNEITRELWLLESGAR